MNAEDDGRMYWIEYDTDVGVEGYPYFLLQQCLQIITTLVRLTVWNQGLWPMTDLFAALADSSSLFPNLPSLTSHHSREWSI
jgi:hypothetical protein